jgi:hypothetical protein
VSVLVGTLAVNVETNQASFTLDAAKSQLDGFGKSAQGAGRMASGGMREAREAVEAAGEAFGVRLPSAISRTVAGMESLGPILASALPFAAIAVGAVMLTEHITKMREEAEKNAAAWDKLGSEGQKSLRHIDDSILEAKIKADELSGKSLAALRLQLQLIDDQTLDALGSQFDGISTKLDSLLEKEKNGWIMSVLWGANGYNEVQDSFTKFKQAYDDALSSGKGSQARELLVDEIIKSQEAIKASSQYDDSSNKSRVEAYQRYLSVLQEINREDEKQVTLGQLKKQNVVTEHEQTLVIHVKPPDWKAYQDSVNKRKEAEERLAEDQLKANEAFTKALQEENKKREKSAQELAEYEAEQTALGKKQKASEGIDSLDNQYKLGLISVQQYVNGKKALLEQEKQAELDYLGIRQAVAQQNLDEANRSDDETAKLTALKQLADATKALSQAQTEYNNKLADMGAQIARDTTAMGAFDAALRQNQTMGAQFGQDWARALEGTNQALAKSIVEGKNFGRAMRQVGAEVLESMIKQMLMSEELAIKKMLMDKLTTVSHLASNAETAASDQATGAMSQLAAAKAAAAKAWQAMSGIPVVGPVLGAVAAAATFAGAMAFAEGGIVPGYGNGDTVPAMLSPGEMVLPKPISQSLQNASSGSSSGNVHWHMPSFQPKVSALDAEGVDKVLTKHATSFERKYKAEMRRRGR